MHPLMLGVLVSMSAATFSSLGQVLMKYAHNKLSADDESDKSYVTNGAWMFAFCVYAVGQVLNVVSYNWLEQAVVAVVGTFGIITNAFFAHYILSESVTSRDFVAIFVIISGGLLALFGNQTGSDGPIVDLHMIKSYFRNPGFIAYGTTIAVICVAALARYQYFSWQGRLTELGGPNFVAITAVMACYSTLFASCAVHLVATSIKTGDSQFNDPLSVIIVVAFVVLICLQMHFMNQGLKYCSALFMVPAYYSTNTILAILCGTIYNRTWKELTYLQCAMFGGGAVIALIGVLILTIKPQEFSQAISEVSERIPYEILPGTGSPRSRNNSVNPHVQIKGEQLQNPIVFMDD